MDQNAIVIVSIGDRPWRNAAAETFDRYAHSHGLQLHIETALPAEFDFPQLPDHPGRRNKLAYACKSYFAWKHLGRYARILVVDDTCCIRPSAPDIFATVPAGLCGYTPTNPEHAEGSFKVIRHFVTSRGLPHVEYNHAHYMNSGVVVYDGSMREALAPERIREAADLLYATYPHQTLSYYLLKRAGIQPHFLSKAFNTIPALNLPKAERRALEDIRPHLSPQRYIYHVTAGYLNRERLIRDISAHFLEPTRD